MAEKHDEANAGATNELSEEEALRWLVGFSQTNTDAIQAMRPGKRLDFFEDLRRYLNVEQGTLVDQEILRAEKKPGLLRPILDLAHEAVNAVADLKRVRFPRKGPQGAVIIDARKLGKGNRRPEIRYETGLYASMLTSIASDLDDSDRAPLIRRCPQCKEIFYANRENQTYCTHKCANRRALARYEQENPGKRAEQERKRYERRKVAVTE